MKLHETSEYAASPEAVFNLIANADFRQASAESSGATDVKVTVDKDGDGATITIVRTQPADVPDFVKKLSGDTVTVKQVEQWGGADAKGGRKAKVRMTIVGQPAGLEGTASITANTRGTAFELVGDVKVNVPFIGKKIEPVIAKAIVGSVKHDVKEGQKKLK